MKNLFIRLFIVGSVCTPLHAFSQFSGGIWLNHNMYIEDAEWNTPGFGAFVEQNFGGHCLRLSFSRNIPSESLHNYYLRQIDPFIGGQNEYVEGVQTNKLMTVGLDYKVFITDDYAFKPYLVFGLGLMLSTQTVDFAPFDKTKYVVDEYDSNGKGSKLPYVRGGAGMEYSFGFVKVFTEVHINRAFSEEFHEHGREIFFVLIPQIGLRFSFPSDEDE